MIKIYTYFENKNNKIYTHNKSESYNFDSHFHSKTEIAYCFSGYQDIRLGNTTYTLQQGDAVIIFPNVIHEYIKHNTDEKTESVSIICHTEYLADFIPDLITKHPLSPFIQSNQISKTSAYAFEMIKDAKSHTELIGWTFVILSDLIHKIDLIPIKGSDEFTLAPNLISYINTNFQKPLTITFLSREFGYSSSYIAHIFYDQLKVPFRTYLGGVRSEYAAKLIETTTKSLTEIAFECGYNSLNTFCRCFKKHFSKTPSEYKKMGRKTK